jgi:hypothetical protein
MLDCSQPSTNLGARLNSSTAMQSIAISWNQSPKTILDERFQEPMPMTYFNNLDSADRQHGTPKRRKHPQVRQQLNPAERSTALGAWASEIQKAKA